MEYENHYSSNGKGNLAVTLGAIGTGLGLLGGNGLGNIFGGNGANCSENQCVNRYELNMQNDITNKDMEIAYLRGRDASKTDDLEMYKYVDGRLRGIESQICQQAVVNAQVSANLSCLQNTVATLSGLTKTIIPIDNVCPAPMPQFNSWVAPTTTTTAAG
jgi:hypothetical protein